MSNPFKTLPPEKPEILAAEIRQVLKDAGIELMGPEEARIVYARLDGIEGERELLCALSREITRHFGAREGRGVALRLGRAGFKYGLRRWGDRLGVNDPEFRLQPAPRKARALLTLFGDSFERNFGSRASLAEDGDYWYWRVEGCPECCGQSDERAAGCQIVTGLLLEALSWAGSGRYFRVEESECAAQGAAACQFRIEKKALD